ncbi:MAG: hypothetical protein AMXMBFR58_18540 [Phycisphaerae bacterium]
MKTLHHHRISSLPLRAAALLAGCAGLCAPARADIISWLFASSGVWSNPAMWSDSNVPNSLADVALINKTGANYTVTVDFDVPIEALTVDSPNATVNLSGNRWMYVAAVDPMSFCHIRQGNYYVQNGATLKCDRKISVSEPNARIYLNNGALEGGELEVNDGGLVQLNGTGWIRTSTTYLGTPGDNSIHVQDGTTLVFDRDGHTISGDGRINMTSSYYGAGTHLYGDVLNDAVFTLSNHGGNTIAAPAAQPDWLFSNYNTVQGSGNLGTNTTNLFNGLGAVIAASHPGGSLVIDPAGDPMSNNGVMKATGGGTLWLQGGTYNTNNPGTGTISAESASRVVINSGALVEGNVLATSDSGVIDLAGSYLRSLESAYPTIITGNVRILDGNAADLGEYFTLTGTLSMHSSYYGSTLNLGENSQFSGGGLLSLSNHGGNVIQSAPAHTNSLHNVDCTIRGSGALGNNSAGIWNLPGGFIEASGSSGLVINPSDSLGCRNEGVMKAIAGGRLYLDGSNFNNLDGTIHADQDGIVYMRTASITGGEFTASGNGYFTHTGGNSTILTDVTSHAPYYIPDGYTTYFRNSFANHATITMQSSYYGTTFLINNGNFVLTGGGTLSLSNHGGNYVYGTTGNLVFTNQDNLITGSGQFGNNQMSVVNNATIQATGSSGLVLNPFDAGGFDNNALLEAANGGRLYLDGLGFDNNDGTIHAADGGIVFLRSAGITGGEFTAAGSGYFTQTGGNSPVLTNVTSHAPVYMPDGYNMRFRNTFINTGVLTMQSSYYGTTFLVEGGDLTLTGGGTISLSNHGSNYVYDASNTYKLINQDNLITGSGQFGNNSLGIVNNATISAAGSSGLVLNPNDSLGLDNNSVMEAAAGGRLYLDGYGFDNSGGVIHAANDGIVFFRTAGITGGQLTATGNGYFSQTGGTNTVLTNVSSSAPVYMPDGHVMRFNGTYNNTGSLFMQSSYYGTTFLLESNVTLTGNGSVILSNHGGNYIYGVSAALVLTNEGNTISGCGQFGNNQLVIVNGPGGKIESNVSGGMNINPSNTGGFTNQGLLRVSGTGVLSINDGPFTTSGQVIVDAGRKLDRTSGDFVQTGGTAIANGEIEVDSNNYLLQGGSLGGGGLVDSNVINSGGSVSPGNSPGTLTIEGNYTQQTGGELFIEVGGKNAGEFDKLIVTGTTSLAGSIRLANLNGYVADPGDQVTVVTSTGALNGVFDQIIQPVTGPRWGVAYVGKTVVLTAFCGADFDGTGFVDTDDFTAFVTAFEAGTDDADFDGTGFVDTDDFTAFVIAFESGC